MSREMPKGYVNEPPTEQLVSYWALFAPMRDYVVEHVKKPLQNAIEGAKTISDVAGEIISFAKKIPKIHKGNTSFYNTHILEDKTNMILGYHTNTGRQPLLENTFKVGIFEYEHDGYYAFIMDMVLIELAMELAKGNWVPRFTKFPIPHCWNGPDLPTIEEIRKQMREALKE